MKTQAIVWSLIVVVLLLAVASFIATHDRVTVKEWVGPTGEARLRPYLAAQRFAERMGLKAIELRALPGVQALPPRGALVVPNQRQELHATRLAELARWVERGGHLIVEAEAVGLADPLLDELGVVRSRAEAPRKPFTATFPGAQRPLTVYLGEALRLEHPAAQVNVAGRVISLPRGAGRVTAVAGLRFARNPGYEDHAARLSGRFPPSSIGAHDHAELFWRILTLAPAAELQVYFRPERLSLWGFLKEHAPYAMASLALLLVLWLWSIVPRFGPVAPDVPPGRRRLLDHLRASGRYFWANGLRSRLVVAARDAALRRMARAQPDFAAASPAEKVARLASIAGISKEDAARFMVAAGAMRGADFIKVTQHAQRVHSALEKGSKR